MPRATWTIWSCRAPGVYRDNNVRADISLDKMATLKTAFDKTERAR